jgi:rhomboid family GlyGly-CTERM serine protease
MERVRKYLFPLMLALVCLLLAAAGDAGRQWLRYERVLLPSEPWRLLTAHLVHLGWSHLLLNLAGLAVIWALVGENFDTRRWLLVFAVAALGVSGGLWLFDPALNWYVGLSGVLHGLLVAGALGGIARRPGESLALLGLVSAKLAWEQFAGPLPGSEASAGGPVVVDAHLFGALAGLVTGVTLRFFRTQSPGGLGCRRADRAK